MQIRPKVSFYHDCRRKLKNGKYPVKIRIAFWDEGRQKQDYYPTGITLNEKEYTKVFSDSVPFALRKTRDDLLAREKEIEDIIAKRPGITSALLESILTGKTVVVGERPVTLEVPKLFDGVIDACEVVGTRNNYRDAKNSILRYGGPGLLLDQIDVRWIEGYEAFARLPYKDNSKKGIIRKCGNTTIAMYLRCLRHVFNDAMDRKIISRDAYPFGKHGYVIRSEQTVKHALNEKEKTSLITLESDRVEERQALMYWMFSYYCHGMNFQDMAHLKPENIRGETIVYVRRKTKNTVKKIKPLVVPVRLEVRRILDELGGHSPFVFGIITDEMDEETRHRKIKQWYRTTNKWVNRIAARLKIPFKVNTYNARHTMAKQLIEKGAHLQNVQEILGHTNILTTQIYTMGMNLEKTKELTDLL
jgi:integrase/recombinase XerD